MSLKNRIERLQAKAGLLKSSPGITQEQYARVQRRLGYLLDHPAGLEIVIACGGPASDFLR